MSCNLEKPVKTYLLNAVRSDVNVVINDDSHVFLDPSRNLHEELTDPYACIFTGNESSTKEDLYSAKTFDLEIHIWVKEDTDDAAREKAIILMAKTQMQLLPRDAKARQWCQYFEEEEGNSSDIMYWDEGLCIAIARYKVKFRHAYGNPFLQNPS